MTLTIEKHSLWKLPLGSNTWTNRQDSVVVIRKTENQLSTILYSYILWLSLNQS